MIVDSLPTYIYKNRDIYILGLANYIEGCEAPNCKAKLKIKFTSDTSFCENKDVWVKANYSGIVGASSITWYLPSGQNISNNSDSLLVTSSGWYKARYHTIPDTCGVLDSVLIMLTPAPKAWLGNDTSICAGSSIKLEPRDTTAIKSFQWSNGANSNSILITQPGTYWVQVWGDCYTERDTITIRTHQIPKVKLEEDTLICPGTSFTLRNYLAKQEVDQYLWSTSDTVDSIQVSQPKAYWLEAKNTCGIVRDTIVISYKDSCICFPLYPQVQLPPDTSICSFDTIKLESRFLINGFSYKWQNGNTSPILVASNPGLYWLEVATYCGSVRDSILIKPKLDGCETAIIFPNAFTPNKDGKNDYFRPITQGRLLHFHLSIYNRWGQLIYNTFDPYRGWDGTLNGQAQNGSVFTWVCRYQFFRKPPNTTKGIVLLIR